VLVLDDETNKKLDKTAKKLGQLWIDVLSLEVLLRQCIAKKYGEEKEIEKLKDLQQDNVVPKNALYNCDTLYNVIEKFNKEFIDQGVQVNRDRIGKLRNAIAHGKIVAPFSYPLKLYNFIEIKGDDNHVRVDFIEEMTDDFMDKNIKYLFNEIKKIINLYEKLI